MYVCMYVCMLQVVGQVVASLMALENQLLFAPRTVVSRVSPELVQTTEQWIPTCASPSRLLQKYQDHLLSIVNEKSPLEPQEISEIASSGDMNGDSLCSVFSRLQHNVHETRMQDRQLDSGKRVPSLPGIRQSFT